VPRIDRRNAKGKTMLDIEDHFFEHCQERQPIAVRFAAVCNLPETALQRAVWEAYTCHLAAWGPHEGSDERYLGDFWWYVDKAAALPARTPGDAAARAALAALLIERECDDAALAMIEALTADLAAMAGNQA
jgi:hypothetical protein